MHHLLLCIYKELITVLYEQCLIIILFQYACDLKAEVIGKPSPTFFQSVLNDMGLQPHEVWSNRGLCSVIYVVQ